MLRNIRNTLNLNEMEVILGEMMRRSVILFIVFMLITLTACSFDTNNKTTKSNLDGTTSSQNDKAVDSESSNSNTEIHEENDSTKKKVALYFSNKDNTALVKEIRSIEISEMAILRATIEALIDGPSKEGLRNTLPEGVSILGIKRDDKTVIVDFSKEYKEKENGITEEFKRISVVNTLTEISGIERVKIMVEGHELLDTDGKAFGEMAKVDLDKNGVISKNQSEVITVYFGSPNSNFIISEKRKVTITANDAIEKKIMEELLKGPENKDLYPVMPENTKILSINTSKDGTCKVNLSKEFENNAFAGSAGGLITINAIVNSLTELKTVKKVQFLIGGKVVETYSDMEFNKPFYRNENIIKN